MPAMVPEAASQPIASFAPSHKSNAVDMWEGAIARDGGGLEFGMPALTDISVFNS